MEEWCEHECSRVDAKQWKYDCKSRILNLQGSIDFVSKIKLWEKLCCVDIEACSDNTRWCWLRAETNATDYKHGIPEIGSQIIHILGVKPWNGIQMGSKGKHCRTIVSYRNLKWNAELMIKKYDEILCWKY